MSACMYLGNAKPGCIFQTRVYGFEGFQTRVPGYLVLEAGYLAGSR